MARAKQASKRKCSPALPMFGAAAMSLAMAGGASAGAPTVNVPSRDKASSPVITLGEEEISDVTLATFYVFDKENESQLGRDTELAAGGCRGCGRGCGGCRGCGRGCGGCRGYGGHGCGGGCVCAGIWWGGCGVPPGAAGPGIWWGGCGGCGVPSAPGPRGR